MQQVIDGKGYDTETAVKVANKHATNGNTLSPCTIILYRSKNGAWFVCAEETFRSYDLWWRDPPFYSGITVLSEEEALKILLAWSKIEALHKYFPNSIQDG